jgi:hypothetical protein
MGHSIADRCIASLIAATLRSQIIASLHRCIAASRHKASLQTSLHRCIAASRIASLHRCDARPLHHRQGIAASQHRIAASLHRCITDQHR